MSDETTETKIISLENRISAYIDGELPESEKAEISTLLMADSDARRIFHRMKLGSKVGNAAFAALLEEPAPLHLTRNIRHRRKGL